VNKFEMLFGLSGGLWKTSSLMFFKLQDSHGEFFSLKIGIPLTMECFCRRMRLRKGRCPNLVC
jgi:hypothetical protein